MLPRLEAHHRDAEGGGIGGQGPAQLLLQAKDQRNRKIHGELAIWQGIVENGKSTPWTRCGVQIEKKYSPPSFVEDALQRIVELPQLLILRLDRNRCGTQGRDSIPMPDAVEIVDKKPPVLGQGLPIPGQPYQVACQAIGLARQALLNSKKGAQTGRLVAVESGQTKNPDSGGTEPTADEIPDDLKSVMEEIRSLFPQDCRFANYTINIKAVRDDTGLQFLAAVPVCIVETNWKDF